jgi:hypothetical protein
MVPLTGVPLVRDLMNDWNALRWDELALGERNAAIVVASTGLALALIVLIIRLLRREAGRRERVALPALLQPLHRSSLAGVRHLPLVLFVAGVTFFILALADPHTRLIREQVSSPGRRIALFVDASGSMMEPFKTTTLQQVDSPAFFTSVAAAEYFMRLRMQGRYRDLIALIEFGDEAYVLTPFTTDYENILLSISLINSWDEWRRFSSQGTVIINALNVAVGLFRSFDFLDASGNVMVMFTDGQDSQVQFEGRGLDAILQQAYENRIPVYMLRVAANKQLGEVVPDEIWKRAIEKTGGQFYPVADEAAILRAMHEIDRRATGRIDVTHYTVNRPRFPPFAGAALLLWAVALVLRLTVPWFSRFP